ADSLGSGDIDNSGVLKVGEGELGKYAFRQRLAGEKPVRAN
ncbi:hypothetical protein SEEH3101_22446, partial [Salmonella enterica subsp. enterica serovar Heidelberg str. 607310-1]